MTQLERDLMHNSYDRLKVWAKDTVMRCEAARLPDEVGLSMIYSGLLQMIIEIAIDLKMPREQLCIIIQQGYDLEVKNKSRNVKNKA